MHNDRIEMILNDYGEYVLEVFTRDMCDNSINTTGRFYIHRKKEEDIYEDDFQELVNTLKPRIDDQPVSFLQSCRHKIEPVLVYFLLNE
jgi:hypothetical protein